MAGVPRITQWLAAELQKGDTVCQNAKLTSIGNESLKNSWLLSLKNEFLNYLDDWEDREESLEDEGLLFVSPDQDLIDAVWPQDERPPKPNSDLMIHDVKYAGSWTFFALFYVLNI